MKYVAEYNLNMDKLQRGGINKEHENIKKSYFNHVYPAFVRGHFFEHPLF